MIKSILLPVDGSAYTESVLRHGMELGQALGALLRVLAVVDVRNYEWVATFGADSFVPVMPPPSYREETEKLLNEKADQTLERAGEFLKKESPEVRFVLEKVADSPIDAIVARENVVDLVIMGQRGEYAKWESRLLGATVEAVSRQLEKPLVVVHQRFRPLSSILVAYDGSKSANRALQLAAELATHLPGSLHVLTVQKEREWAERVLNEASAYLEAYGLEVQSSWTDGDPEDAILRGIAELGVDLAVLGGHGHSRLREAILGSTAVHVMRRAPVPVCMVK
ncbi:MAG: universal stress protein [candidate division KSB1 bacterium]|nr:universal stress protein [candidate division KSB1 bacterium]